MSANSTTSAPWIFHRANCLNYGKMLSDFLVMMSTILFLHLPIIYVLVRKLRNISVGNAILLHLSVADFLLFLGASCNKLVLLIGSPHASTFFCQLTAFIVRFTHTASIYFITVMAACRCYSVVKPFQYRAKARPSKIHKICFGAWCFALVFAVMPFIGWGEYEPVFGQCRCALNTHKYPYNWLMYFIFNYFTPVILNSVFLASIFKTLRSQKNNLDVIRKNKARNILASVVQRSKTNPTFHSESGACRIRGFKEASMSTMEAFQGCDSNAGRVFEESSGKRTVQVEIHRRSCASQRRPPSCKRNQKMPGENLPKVEITEMESATYLQSADKDKRTEEQDVGNLDEAKPHAQQESHPQQESVSLNIRNCAARNEIQPHLESIDKDEKTKIKNEMNLETKETHCQQEVHPHIVSITLHQRNIVKRTPNENKRHLESIVEDEKSNGENKEEIMVEDEKSNGENKEEMMVETHGQEVSHPQLEPITLRQPNTEKRAWETQHKQASKDHKVFIITLVFASFVVLCCPSAIIRSWYALTPDAVPVIAFPVVDFLAALNSLVNPFLYGLLNKEIRSDIKKLYRRLWTIIMRC